MVCRDNHKDYAAGLYPATGLMPAQGDNGPRCRMCDRPLRKDSTCVQGCRQADPIMAADMLAALGGRRRPGEGSSVPYAAQAVLRTAKMQPAYYPCAPERLVQAIQQLPGHLASMVTSYSPEQYRQMGAIPYLSADGQSGFAIKPDGELISVFSLVRGRGDELVEAALQMGARRLDCFEPYLPRLYGRHGFQETDRYQWDDKYAPPLWDYARFGRPDVVVMERVAV